MSDEPDIATTRPDRVAAEVVQEWPAMEGLTMDAPIYTEGVCDDGAAILRDGVPVSISDVLDALNSPARRARPRAMTRPQRFSLDDLVQVRQDGSAPVEWAGDWAGVTLRIVGVHVDEHRPGRCCYIVQDEPHDPMAEDWLEPAAQPELAR